LEQEAKRIERETCS